MEVDRDRNMNCMEEDLKNELSSTLDFAKYFLKRWILRPISKASDVDTVSSFGLKIQVRVTHLPPSPVRYF